MAWTEFPLPTTMVWQSGMIQVRNVAGVLKHLIASDSGVIGASNNVDRVSGASATEASTPTVSSTVDFVSGGGIDSTGTNRFVLNTASQTLGNRMGGANIELDTTGSSFHKVALQVRSLNINGVTRNWFTFTITDNSGNDVAISTANIGATKAIRIAFWIAML